MNTGTKVAIGVGAVILIGGGIWYFSKKKVADNLDVTLENVSDISADLTGIHGTITVALHNPTNAQLRVKYPYVKIYIDGKFMGNSDIKDQLIHIAPNSTTEVDIDLNLSSVGTLLALPAIIQDVSAGKALEMEIRIKTGLEFTDLPEIVETIPLSL